MKFSVDYQLDVRMIGRKHRSHFELTVSKKLVELAIPAINAEELLEQREIETRGDHSRAIIEKHYCVVDGELKDFALLSNHSTYTNDASRLKRLSSYGRSFSAASFMEFKPTLFEHESVEGDLCDRMGNMKRLTPLEQSFQNYWVEQLQYYLKRLYCYQGFIQHTKLETEITYWENLIQTTASDRIKRRRLH